MNMGRVRNIVVHDIKSFKESLIRTLIRLDVNYVNLSNSSRDNLLISFSSAFLLATKFK